MATESVKIVIRDIANRNHVLRADVNQTIGEIKQNLEENLPARPPASTQKLIFAGRLLNDAQQVKDALGSVSHISALIGLCYETAEINLMFMTLCRCINLQMRMPNTFL